MADGNEAPQYGEGELRVVLAAHLSQETMTRLELVVERSGLSIRDILSQAIDVAWDVALSGDLTLPVEVSNAVVAADTERNTDSSLPSESLTPLLVPIPPRLAETFGYEHDARYVAFYWETVGDEVMFDDGRRAGTADWYAFQQWRDHPAVSTHAQNVNLGFSDLEATQWLIIDRERNLACVAYVSSAQAFLKAQHPPPRAIVRELLHEFQAVVTGALRSAMKDLQLDPTQIECTAHARQQAIEEMVAYLDKVSRRSPIPPDGT